MTVGAQPEEVRGDAGQLHQHHPDVLGPLGHFDAQQLFHGQAEAEEIGLPGQIVQAVHQGHAPMVSAVFAHFLDAPVQVADIRVSPQNEFAVQLQQDPEHPVGAGMRRPQVEEHGFGAL